jgi:hypothetical protein
VVNDQQTVVVAKWTVPHAVMAYADGLGAAGRQRIAPRNNYFVLIFFRYARRQSTTSGNRHRCKTDEWSF